MLAQLHGPHEDFSSWREATPPSVQHRRPSHHLDARSDAPTRAATADSAPPSRPLRHLFGILSRPVLDCVLLCSASEHLRFLFWLLQKRHASGVSPCTKLVLNEDRDILLERAGGVPTRHPDREKCPQFPFLAADFSRIFTARHGRTICGRQPTTALQASWPAHRSSG